MKVLLCEDVKDLGWLGDVCEVNDGYARNYLLPQNLAVIPTDGNLKALASEKAKRAEQRIHDRKRLEGAIAAVEGAEAVVAATANEQGHLFGSVTAHEIAENLRQQGFEVAVVTDATAAAQLEEGDGYQAAMVNFRFIANAVWTTEEAVNQINGNDKKRLFQRPGFPFCGYLQFFHGF